MVEQWSPKPKVKGSNPFSPDKNGQAPENERKIAAEKYPPKIAAEKLREKGARKKYALRPTKPAGGPLY